MWTHISWLCITNSHVVTVLHRIKNLTALTEVLTVSAAFGRATSSPDGVGDELEHYQNSSYWTNRLNE